MTNKYQEVINRNRQCCTIIQAIELEKLGIIQKSFWYFVYYPEVDFTYLHTSRSANEVYNYRLRKLGEKIDCELYSAFNLSELLCMLNQDVILKAEDIKRHASIIAEKLIYSIKEQEVFIKDVNARIIHDHANS